MSTATAAKVVQYLETEVFHMFGVPEFVHSDNGKQFVCETFKSFLEKYGVIQVRTALYSPQANAAERVNQSVLQMLRSYLGTDQRKWDEHISDAAFALRSAKHSSIGMEPYFAVFGVNMVQHGAAYDVNRQLQLMRSAEVMNLQHCDKQQLVRDRINVELQNAHKRAEKVYNTRSKQVQFQVGQIVYRKNFRQSKLADGYNAKLGHKNVKCVVLKAIGNSLYELGNSQGRKVGVFHAKDILSK
ncbi:uncharacterized protein LOC119663672 [Teleopsis dalmanni]|uniref:uncharacterized protein LOC119663672 n=1 Tax=Teleopsis dalmanni TaxID=139649 RepID=UPI0018CEC78E|nr:uncharacterized protein LOC119663672 [Teleopsis dalmanni]